MEGRQTVNGNDDIDTFDAFDFLGQVLGRQGLYIKTAKLHQSTLKARRGMLGEGHAWGGASFLADQHGQPGVDVLKLSLVEGG